MRWLGPFLLLLQIGCDGAGDAGATTDEPTPLPSTISREGVRIREKWRPVARIVSRRPHETVFRITGKEGRLHWKNKEPGEFVIILRDADQPESSSRIVANVMAPDEDVIFLEGKKRYALEVIGRQAYEVLVEELR
ncbi:MAG: hypothetical protein NZ958_00920 [Bacteroidia bacterium]|nr:hypothetical protein [Bacteroidia bacterium]MDW8089225.1 hypothetical protein [Bacteroidia bacterium]